MFKFLHTADIHLDSPLKGLERYDGAPVEQIRQATRRALQNLVQLAIQEQVDFVLIAGDLYDGNWKDFKTGRFFLAEMFKLREAGIPVVLIAGNHDAANKMTRDLDLRPAGVTMLGHERPETVRLEAWDVAIHGQSFGKAAVEHDLSAGYPAGIPGWFNIGLLHTCGPGGGDGHARYAPCSLDGLRQKNYQYWALGHIHRRQQLCDDPPVVFCGNLQGRHVREEGPKGCTLVTVDGQQRVTIEERHVDVLRWQVCRVDVGGAATVDDVLEAVRNCLAEAAATLSGGLPLAVRLQIVGGCRAHERVAAEPATWENEIRTQAQEVGGGSLWIEKVRFATALPPELALARCADGPLAELVRTVEEIQADPEQLAAVGEELRALIEKLPAELTEGDGALGLTDPDTLRATLDQVCEMLIRQLQPEAAR